jgi:hypothetical protein
VKTLRKLSISIKRSLYEYGREVTYKANASENELKKEHGSLFMHATLVRSNHLRSIYI